MSLKKRDPLSSVLSAAENAEAVVRYGDEAKSVRSVRAEAVE